MIIVAGVALIERQQKQLGSAEGALTTVAKATLTTAEAVAHFMDPLLTFEFSTC